MHRVDTFGLAGGAVGEALRHLKRLTRLAVLEQMLDLPAAGAGKQERLAPAEPIAEAGEQGLGIVAAPVTVCVLHPRASARRMLFSSWLEGSRHVPRAVVKSERQRSVPAPFSRGRRRQDGVIFEVVVPVVDPGAD